MDILSPAFVDALKNVAEVVALAIIGYLMLRLIVEFILKLISGTSTEAERSRTISENLTVAINELTVYLQHSDRKTAARADRNMLMNVDRFDDLEYLIEGVLQGAEKERLLIVQERRKIRQSKYTMLGLDDEPT